jgi:2-methylcitrate dehydratase PrpD
MSAATGKRDAICDLVEYVMNLHYEDLPQSITEVTKRCVLDTLGVTIAASTLDPSAKEIVDLVKEAGGKEEATILGFGGKVPCWMAAFVNGAMGHMVDYDDAHEIVSGHPSITTALPGFAIAERLGKVSGKDFILAVASGTDVMIRLGRAIRRSPQGRDEWTMDKGWFGTQLFGFMSGAATVGKLLGLNEKQMVYALGIASAQLCGSRQMGVNPAAETRAIQGAWTGKGAILSALLAQRGVTGATESLEGRYGLYKVYFQAEPDRDSLVGELGKRFEGDLVRFKPWPCCNYTHAPIYATLELMREHHIHADDVEGVKIIGGTSHTQLLSEPIESKRKPQTSIDAKYSIPFTVAVAVTKGNVSLRDFTPESLKATSVLRMAEKISYQYVPEIADKREKELPSVQIKTKTGNVYSMHEKILYGDPEKPICKEDLIKKFKDCISFSVIPIPPDNIEKVIEMVGKLEEVDDVSRIMRLLDPSSFGEKK